MATLGAAGAVRPVVFSSGARARTAAVAWCLAATAWVASGAAVAQTGAPEVPDVRSGLRVLAPVEDGLWRVTTMMTPAWPAPEIEEGCISAKGIARDLHALLAQDGHCQSTLVANDATRAQLHMHCAPLGGLDASAPPVGILVVTAASPQAFQVAMEMQDPASGNKQALTQDFERLGACTE